MCQFKSGIIFKNRVVLAPEGNESHSDLLKSLGIEDIYTNATKRFVRVELIPPNNDQICDIKEWKYKVDQDIVPDWYERDPDRYKQEFIESVRRYMEDWKNKNKFICGYYWTSITDGNFTYYFMNGILKKTIFGNTNNYSNSYVRNCLINSKLVKKIQKEFKHKLVPISLDLISINGFKDYGMIEGDILAIPNIQLLMKFGKSIPLINNCYWLSTPNMISKRKDTSYIQIVNCNGRVLSCDCDFVFGIRPFFILQS